MGYFGVFLKAFQLGKEAAEDVKIPANSDLSTKNGMTKFREKAYDNVEAYQQLGEYSYIGGELMQMKNPDAAVNKYDSAISDGINSVLKLRIKQQKKKGKK